jgi:hypothetical protein
MSRSVSTPRNATSVVYLHNPQGDQDCGNDWEDFLLDLRQVLSGIAGAPGGKGFPSLEECDIWLGREDHAVMENRHAYVTVSEYNGVVAVCLVPKNHIYSDEPIPLAANWCAKVAKHFVSLATKAYESCALISNGRASNGEQFFSPVSRPEGVVTSKEGVLELF